MDASNATSWLQLVQQFGLPMVLFFGLVGLLLGAGFLLWKWARPRLDQLIDAVVGLIDSLKVETKRYGDSLEAVQADLDEVRAHMARAGDKLERIERQGDNFEVVRTDLNELRTNMVRVGDKLDRIERQVERAVAAL